MTKSEIVESVLREQTNNLNEERLRSSEYADDEQDVILYLAALLLEAKPGANIRTCIDFINLNVDCCETCHHYSLPYEMSPMAELTGGGHAWICCAIERALGTEIAPIPQPADELVKTAGYTPFADFFGGKYVQNERKVTKAENEVLDQFAGMKERSKDQRRMESLPEVGIFFVYENRLLIEGTPVKDAQPYGNFIGHAKGHPSFWSDLQRNDTVPRDVEYDEVSRGRVGFDAKEKTFHIFLDPCILEEGDMLGRIASELNLPSSATAPPELDSHYKCPRCRKKSKGQLQQEEEDWDF